MGTLVHGGGVIGAQGQETRACWSDSRSGVEGHEKPDIETMSRGVEYNDGDRCLVVCFLLDSSPVV
jgi:hypothetical protein